MITIPANSNYHIARFGSIFYLTVSPYAVSAVEGADEVIHACTDYTFDVTLETEHTVEDSEGIVYQRVQNSLFKPHFIAQLPPYNPL